MTRFWHGGLAVVSLVSSLVAGPKIHVDETLFNFGSIPEDSLHAVSHTFKIRNTGNEPLVIEKAKAG